MEDTINANRDKAAGRILTVREIKGLLTRIGHDLVRSLSGPAGPQPATAEAQPVEPRRFVESMISFLRMN